MMEFEKEYYWVVLCKNRLFHYRQNISSGHKILLAETDAVSPPTRLESPFSDDCGKEYTYKPSEVLRFETELPPVFLTHPLFADLDSL